MLICCVYQIGMNCQWRHYIYIAAVLRDSQALVHRYSVLQESGESLCVQMCFQVFLGMLSHVVIQVAYFIAEVLDFRKHDRQKIVWMQCSTSEL